MARSAIVLAGGRASRFGSDKTRALVDGVPLLERVVAAAAPLVDEVLVVGPWAPPGTRLLLEPERHHGPLAALAFGLRQVAPGVALVLAADHPHLQPALVELLLERQDGGSRAAVVPRTASGPEPLVAVYRTSVADDADELLRAGERRLQALLDRIDVEWVDESAWTAADPTGRSFHDIDDPNDLAASPDPQR